MKLWRIGTRTVIALSVLIGATGAAGMTAAARADEPQTPGEVLQAGVARMQLEQKLPGVIGMVRDGDSVAYAHAGWGDMFMRCRRTRRRGSVSAATPSSSRPPCCCNWRPSHSLPFAFAENVIANVSVGTEGCIKAFRAAEKTR
ncbi:hypothetical protein GCM10023191_041940 [Actinoallomurus oryzae]|uniref:Beta-lactamase n=1 Tax=Actinoallomurus oryzae TaxID=502180 RepID=A0ABP8Q7K7_9ACTN